MKQYQAGDKVSITGTDHQLEGQTGTVADIESLKEQGAPGWVIRPIEEGSIPVVLDAWGEGKWPLPVSLEFLQPITNS